MFKGPYPDRRFEIEEVKNDVVQLRRPEVKG